MMKAARLVILLLLVATCVSGTATNCNSLLNSHRLSFNVTIAWTYNTISQTCRAHKLDPGLAAPVDTEFAKNETKSIETLGNECLKFTCIPPNLVLNIQNSSCPSEQGCSTAFKKSEPGCDIQQQCTCLASGYYHGHTYNNDIYGSNLLVLTQIVCTPEQWPAYPGYPFYPAHWPYPVYHPGVWPESSFPALVHPVTGDGFHWSGAFHWIPYHGGAFPGLPGGFVPAPVPSGSRSLTTPDPKDCSKEGMVIFGFHNSTCALFKCTKDSSGSYYFEIQPVGCYYNGSCYRDGTAEIYVDKDKIISCHLDSAAGQYNLVEKCNGCIINGKCMPVGTVNTSLECKHLKCVKNDENQFQFKVEYKGCYELQNNSCIVDDQETVNPKEGECTFATCEAKFSAKWNIQYKTMGRCSMFNAPNETCTTPEGLPGCLHDSTCHPVKTVLTRSKCTQFVCYSDDVDLNNGTSTNVATPPVWEPRATGCYGPLGCMEFGEQFVDNNTGNTYRCNYTIGGMGHKFPEFHEGCVLPDGTPLALGHSVLYDGVYYGCSHDRVLMTVPANKTEFIPENRCEPCGINPVTKERIFLSVPYYLRHAICDWKHSCVNTNCTYFDQRCYGESESPIETRSLGDKFVLNNIECVCTQDNYVQNYQFHADPHFSAPSLCAELGVRGGACRDSDNDTIVRQWGELWVRPEIEPLEICTCHPANRTAFCSAYMPDVINLSSKNEQ